MLCDLYGRDNYQDTIKEGKRYWYYWCLDTSIVKKYGSGWYEIEITYIRSGCMFYTFVEYPDIPEDYCAVSCFLAAHLIPSELDPIKDLPKLSEDLELNKLTYYFDDEYTVIKNWDNNEEVEVTQEKFNELSPIQQLTIQMNQQ